MRRPARLLQILSQRPAALVGVAYGIALALLLATHAWDARFFATVGPEWLRHDPAGTKAADGMIFHAIAEDPLGRGSAFGAYRMERILYPLLARVVAFGMPSLIPWALVLINWAAIVLGTGLLHRILSRAGAPGWMALAYGAWAGLGLALLKDTAEPLAYLSAILGIWWLERGRPWPACGAFLAALLGRETALLLIGPYLLTGTRRVGIPRWLPGLVVLALWQAWVLALRLWLHGSPAPQRSVRLVPLAGFHATRSFDLPFSVLYLVIPAVVILGLAIRRLRHSPRDAALWAAVLNALLVLSLPPGTAALVWHSARVSTGLVASLVLATPHQDSVSHTWRALAVLFSSSSCWTAAVVIRYLVSDVVVVPGE